MNNSVLLIAIAIIGVGCSTQRKIHFLEGNRISADISVNTHTDAPDRHYDEIPGNDTTVVQEDNGGPVIMNAVRDENGEMTATDVIKAAMVTARFRNIAERHGKVDLQFRITVPAGMQDEEWQIRMMPRLYILEDSLEMEPIFITGARYRMRQLRGYEQYHRFLASIISDPEKFINAGQLELFIRRNIHALYRFRSDSSFVSDEEFASAYGITEQEAVEHYTRRHAMMMNEKRKGMKDKMFSRYVKSPIVNEGIRLDSIIVTPQGDFIYDYTQTIATRPKLRKAEITLSGAIYEEGMKIYSIPESEAITFYISSLSSFTDKTVRYLTRTVSRRVEANTACYVDFASGKSEIVPDLGHNRTEIGRIQKNLSSLLEDKEFDLDSIIVTASSSPEGKYRYNMELSHRRARAVSGYFDSYLKSCRDSIRRNQGVFLSLGSAEKAGSREIPDVRFISRTAGENWKMLDNLVDADTVLSPKEKIEYANIAEEQDPDKREMALSKTGYYRHLREHLYPKLRTVRFDFHLHRKGMVMDTVTTTAVDSVYMSGVAAIEDRDYRKAISLLRPYNDFNLAVAYCAMDYNASAMSILRELPETDKTLYMTALIYSRLGNHTRAVENYMKSCSMNPGFIHRGNLDPEISVLIKRYQLHYEMQN